MTPPSAAPQTLPALSPVESSAISAAGYDKAARKFLVQFKTTGHIHAYSDVPPEIAQRFEEAESKGAFFGRWIRPVFKAEKLTGDCNRCGDTAGLIGRTCDSCGVGVYVVRV